MCPHKVQLPEELLDDDRAGEVLSKPGQTKYLNRPPTIMPNYGKKKQSLLPKSNISRVLLYDNVMQQQMLDVKLSNLKVEQSRSGRILDLHKKSFIVRQARKQRVLRAMGITNVSFLPKISDDSAEKSLVGKRKHSDSTYSSGSGKKMDELAQDANLLNLPETMNDEIESVKNANFLPDIMGNRDIPFEGRENQGLTTYFSVRDTNQNGAEETGKIIENGRGISNGGSGVINKSNALTVKSAISFNRDESKLHVNGSSPEKPVFSAPVRPRDVRRWPSIVHDPRFQALQKTLQTMELHTEGYIELSPSFRRQYVTIPEHLISEDDAGTSEVL